MRDFTHYTLHQLSVDKDAFTVLLKHIWSELKPEWIVCGFRKCGLYPVNRTALSGRMLAEAEEDVEAQDEEPVEERQLSVKEINRGKLMDVLKGAFEARESALVTEVLGKKKGVKRNVQAAHGEIMTAADVAERLKEIDDEKEGNKRQKKGPTTTPKGGPTGVHISMLGPSKDKPARTATSGNLDEFVIREAPQSVKPVKTRKDTLDRDVTETHAKSTPLEKVSCSFANILQTKVATVRSKLICK